jgi:hypothetical protein
MTTCAECLAVVSTMRLSDIPANSAISAHISTCPNCSRLVTDIQLAERRLGLSLDASMPTMPPTQIAGNAIMRSELARRESVARWIRRALAFGAGLLVVLYLRTDRGESLIRPDDFRRQSVELNCLSKESAMDLAIPYLRSSSGRIYAVRGRNVVIIEGVGAEVTEALVQINRMDDATHCDAPRATAAPVNPSVGTPGKD